MNPLSKLNAAGQAVWLDYIRRDLLEQGGLAQLVEDDAVTGVTSNPAIFEQAIGGSDLYDAEIERILSEEPDVGTVELYERLAVTDIRAAADILRPVWDRTEGADGYVSLEVSPELARDTEGTIEEARRLWARVDRPNLMIKVPATAEGIPAISTLLSERIHVNVTLMFSLADYEAVAQAYLDGLSKADDPAGIASVASFFVSRVDSEIDAALEASGRDDAADWIGRAGIANSKLAYRRYQEIFEGEDFRTLASRGARPQRVLWASTSTKNPAFRDVLYVEELIGPQTVNTLPPATLEAFRDHGEVRQSLTEGIDEAERALAALDDYGIDLDRVTAELQRIGVEKFAVPFRRLMETLDAKREALVAAGSAG